MREDRIARAKRAESRGKYLIAAVLYDEHADELNEQARLLMVVASEHREHAKIMRGLGLDMKQDIETGDFA